MKEYKKIPYEVSALIPTDQLKITRRNIKEFQDGIELLENQLSICPNIRQTDGMKEHPCYISLFLQFN